jgi:hypothetical protein
MEWIDEPWPERLQDSLKKLWREVRMTKRYGDTTSEALAEALRTTEIAVDDRNKLQEEVDRTTRVAERVFEACKFKDATTAKSKKKLVKLVYSLIAAIVFLVLAIIYKK